MSLHAQLSPEALARLQAQQRNSTLSSVAIAALAIILLGLTLGFILLDDLIMDTVPFTTYVGPDAIDPPTTPPKVTPALSRKTPAPAANRTKVIVVNTVSSLSIPVPEVVTTTPSVDFGDGDDFGDTGMQGNGPGSGFDQIPERLIQRCTKADRLARLHETGGTPACDDAVGRALQWLKSTQSQDGSWPGGPAITGLALLAYLGHCETPMSADFGDSSLRAITYLVNLGMKNHGKLTLDTKNKHWPYEHAIATYALAEAATFCKSLRINIPKLQEVTQQAGQFIIDNQHASGGWDYSYAETGDRGGDLSISAWHLQALKACKHTGIDFRNLPKCVARALDYTAKLQAPSGGFGYATPSSANADYFTLTGAGVLGLQLWDKGSGSAVRDGARYIDKNTKFDYDTQFADLYGHYYEAQAMLNRGGVQWQRYNTLFRDQFLNHQNPDGSWQAPGGGKTLRAVAPQYVQDVTYRTCLCALMLEVYYRFLPATGANPK